MSLHLRFFTAIDRLSSPDTPVLATTFGRDCSQLLQRAGSPTRDISRMSWCPFLDSECEVEVEPIPMRAATAIAVRWMGALWCSR